MKHLASAFGVTRLARLTGLDRLGVEVVGAVRPRGHVLQVSQGKGRTLEAAQWSALGEAIELSAAETPDLERLRFGSRSAWWDFGLTVAWVEGRELHTGARVRVPAESVYCPPAGRAWFGPSVSAWSSNGLGAHPTSRARASEHALLELVERDALARTLPAGWTESKARRCFVREVPTAPGFIAFAFDLTPRAEALHTAGVLLFDLEESVVPLTAGYACRRSYAEAEEAAFLEAAQSRLTEIHGAREDVLIGDREAGAELLALLRTLKARGPSTARARGALAPHVRGRVALVELRAAPFVVKAVSPDLLVSELL